MNPICWFREYAGNASQIKLLFLRSVNQNILSSMKKILIIALVCWNPVLFAQDRLTPEKLWQFERVSDEQVSPDGEYVIYGVTRYDLKENKGHRDLFVKAVSGGETINLTENISASVYNGRWRPDGRKIGFLMPKDGITQLWEMNTDGSEVNVVSNFDKDISNFAYAPDMRHISFTQDVKLDQTINEKYDDLPEAEARLIDDLMYRHWDEWHNYSYSHVFYAPYTDGKITGNAVDIMEEERFDTPLKPFGGSEDIAWSPDGNKILYVCKKSEGKAYAVSTNSDLYLYDLNTKQTKNITQGLEGYDTAPAFSNNGTMIAWLNMSRPGFEADRNVIHIYDLETDQYKAVTSSLDASASNIVWNNNDELIYFISGVEATYQVFQVDLGSGQFAKMDVSAQDIKPVTDGWHNYYSLALADNMLVASKTTMSMPMEIFTIDPESGKEVQLTFVNSEKLKSLNLGKVEKRLVKTSDNKDMLVWVIYPPGFNPDKKYPTLLYCQGGPQSAVSQFFSYRWNFQLMAANDYIIVAPNRRGLPTFGQEWNDQISEDWGGQSMQDYLAAIDSLAKEPFVDNDNLGAVGASYGGYSVYHLAGIHNGRFKTFISHCGVFNLQSWLLSGDGVYAAGEIAPNALTTSLLLIAGWLVLLLSVTIVSFYRRDIA